MVRDPLVWLGCADPVASVEMVRAADQTLNNLAALAAAWKIAIGLGNPLSCAAVLDLAGQHDDKGVKLKHAALAEALEPVAADRGKPSAVRLGQFLSRVRGRRIDGLWFEAPAKSRGILCWQLMSQEQGQ
jgi:putative DNA primase/helicase